jgi:MFS superfamily sulfate permease-like transporter
MHMAMVTVFTVAFYNRGIPNMSPIFDQRGQKVTYQYNAAGNINFGAVENRANLISELEKLKEEVALAGNSSVDSSEIVTDAQYQIQKALDQAKKPEPIKSVILDHLSQAKGFVKGLVEAGGLVTGIMKAIELVQKLF